MSIIANNLLQGDEGYNIARSLRLRSSASAYLNRTPASTGNRKTWTYSCWLKRGALSTDQSIFSAGEVTVPWFGLFLVSSNKLEATFLAGSGAGSVTAQVFRDPSAWYHIVVAVDTTQATTSNRLKIYVNGVQATFESTNYPSQNTDTQVNNTTVHKLGSNNYPFDGYLTEVNFIDGQALTPSSFGETDAVTGVWKPKKYAGTYGTNGFFLNFSDNSSNTATTIGKDYSGNGNNWTPNNISVTAGATYDSMTDVPTMSALGSNYATLNPLLQSSWWAAVPRATIQDGNLTAVTGAGSEAFANFDFVANQGKWYFEVNCSATDASNGIVFGASSRSTFEVTYYQGGNKQINGAAPVAYGATWTSGDVIGVAVDVPNNQITFYKNNVSQGTITNTFPTTSVFAGMYGNSASGNYYFNFGQRPFSFSPPSGYVALNCFNLP